MHELSICQGIGDIARTVLEALPPPPPRVSRVTVRIGRLTSVLPDSLRYHFDLLARGSLLDGATLDVEEVPVRGRCADCGGRFEIDVLSFTCPACGSGVVELLSGRELQVVSLDLVEEVPRGR